MSTSNLKQENKFPKDNNLGNNNKTPIENANKSAVNISKNLTQAEEYTVNMSGKEFSLWEKFLNLFKTQDKQNAALNTSIKSKNTIKDTEEYTVNMSQKEYTLWEKFLNWFKSNKSNKVNPKETTN
ncbi:uncharacterized protein ACRADG_006138 [Cochliomyia hominivorax]